MHVPSVQPIPRLLFAAGAAILALQPVLWLTHTWLDPAYDSHGLTVALLAAGLLGWSLRSPGRPVSPADSRRAFLILALTAAVRLAGQVLAVNVIGALALVLDVYALGLLLGLERRARPLSPGWLALVFAFSLPLERVAQRTVGYALQQLSASGACRLLALGEEVECRGVRILLAGKDVLVDLPCSGARGLLLLLLLFAVLAALIRPTFGRAMMGLAVTLAAAVFCNVLRITVLALGLAYPPAGFSVLEAPWHEAIGLAALLLGALPVLLWARYVPRSSIATEPVGWAERSEAQHSRSIRAPALGFLRQPNLPVLSGFAFVAFAALILALPARPVDVARPLQTPPLPRLLDGLAAAPVALSPLEQAYFVRYGGGAARAAYGPYRLLVVRTTAPLRHLHDPEACLRGSGHRVRYLGWSAEQSPAALYRSVDPEGRTWRVTVNYVSERGETAVSIAEVVWRWLKNPTTAWTMVQRVAPWEAPYPSAWDQAAARALDLPSTAL